MILLLDLDGTLTNTAHPNFKEMKDGKAETVLEKIPLFDGAKEFVEKQKEKGNLPIIVSDSHPKYVNKIATEIFNVDSISLTDKPNIHKTQGYIEKNDILRESFNNKDNFLMIGDSWLDIELGRRLNIRTVLTKFYKATAIEERDGIGQDWKPIKMGPTFCVKNFEDLNAVINNPIDNLLALESIFQGGNSSKAVDFKFQKYHNGFTAFRCLARQNDGECDRFARADKYYQIDNPNRTPQFLENLAKSAENYINEVLTFNKYSWDYFTYVPDKSTTKPANKMKAIFDLVNTPVEKALLFNWNDNIDGKLRNRPNYASRRKFISENLFFINGFDIKGKSIIVLDDQFTSSATAYEISSQLRQNGAKNILFIALFYLILHIESKACPKCEKPLKIKIKKIDGKRFYSCMPPKFGGNGCGHIENITE